MAKCKKCQDEGWVCENHPDKPWDRSMAGGCQCGAGMPCIECNPCDEHHPPRHGITNVVAARGKGTVN